MSIAYKYPSITAKVLKSLRRKNEYSQEYLGRLIGKSRSTIYRIENAIKTLKPTELDSYLESLNSSSTDFLKVLSSLVFLHDFSDQRDETVDRSRKSPSLNRLDNRGEIIAALKSYFSDKPVRKVYLFGSIARGEFNHESDIDLYLEFDEKAKVSIFDLSKMKIDILMKTGREADLVLKGSEYSFVTSAINRDKTLVYEQA